MTIVDTPRAVYIDEPHRIRVAAAEPRPPRPGEALVRVAWSGICGSDREMLAGGRPEGFVRYPVVPGHEWSGTVESVGDPIDAALVGKAVVGEGFRSCGRCDACRRGDNNLCGAPYDETGFTRPGAWSDYLTLPARLLHVLPDGSDLRAAAALEPAACVAAACLKVAPVPGERVAVVGAGTLGMLATQLLHAGGPAELAVVVRRPDRVELAHRCGATGVLSPAEADRLAGRFDVVVEAAGTTGAARTAVRLAGRGGRVALTGIPSVDEAPPSPTDLVLNQITVHTVFGAPSRAWSHAVRAFASGALDPAALITHEIPLDDVTEAFRVLSNPAAGAVKVLLRP
ncbi:MAG TPA: alcohol dehydrogenase catalytic domain-containing protein [Actinophytocola sp.]|uniref:zinc-dependent alcohol dehydrogenase n=1 Tax=Actinophytocola sp. TaxID=1872138 RepID=UPI002DDDB4F2|nr:alcohol dehydrogenase catalytic domain-containing protein [Actinophytocola sp.]HEV2784042.1 alcohol dehydrogenase catalytic domain-containing protein [Actinophytocola sp.]